jgi:hypothetical protein
MFPGYVVAREGAIFARELNCCSQGCALSGTSATGGCSNAPLSCRHVSEDVQAGGPTGQIRALTCSVHHGYDTAWVITAVFDWQVTGGHAPTSVTGNSIAVEPEI